MFELYGVSASIIRVSPMGRVEATYWHGWPNRLSSCNLFLIELYTAVNDGKISEDSNFRCVSGNVLPSSIYFSIKILVLVFYLKLNPEHPRRGETELGAFQIPEVSHRWGNSTRSILPEVGTGETEILKTH